MDKKRQNQVRGMRPWSSKIQPVMKTDGQVFLDQLATFPANTFEGKFLKISVRLGLGWDLAADELSLLYRAAFQESSRVRLENEFMIARDRLYATCGWKNLRKSQCAAIENGLLRVIVEEHNLAK
jgi:hypothetical protein